MEILFYIFIIIISQILCGCSGGKHYHGVIGGASLRISLSPSSGPLNSSTDITVIYNEFGTIHFSNSSDTDVDADDSAYIYNSGIKQNLNTSMNNIMPYDKSGVIYSLPAYKSSMGKNPISIYKGYYYVPIIFGPKSHTTTSALFTYLYPTITLDKYSGSYQLSTSVTITGINFSNLFNGSGVTVTVLINNLSISSKKMKTSFSFFKDVINTNFVCINFIVINY